MSLLCSPRVQFIWKHCKIAVMSGHFTPVFSVTWSFRNHADLQLKKHFLLLAMLKTAVLPNILVETMIHIFQYSLMDKSIYLK